MQEFENGDGSSYTVRPWTSGDRSAFLDLHERVFGGGHADWFAWKFEDNPYTDHMPIVVAESDGDLVGAKPAWPLRLRAGEESILAYELTDAMVHPDHRREGLFSRMTAFTKRYYADRDPDLFFNFPNRKTMAGAIKHGWVHVGRVPTFYRVQTHEAVLDGGAAGGLAAHLTPLVRTALRATDRVVGAPDASVVRHDGVPPGRLAALYRQRVPDALHARRDETFYEWRYGRPGWTYRAYTADGDGTPAGMVVGVGRHDGMCVLQLADVVPLVGDGRRPALAALLQRVLADHSGVDLVVTSGEAVPPRMLLSHGFLPDTWPPLEWICRPTNHVAYSLSDPDRHGSRWTVGGRDVRRSETWRLTFAEQDTY